MDPKNLPEEALGVAVGTQLPGRLGQALEGAGLFPDRLEELGAQGQVARRPGHHGGCRLVAGEDHQPQVVEDLLVAQGLALFVPSAHELGHKARGRR